jgi:hypothetical protein
LAAELVENTVTEPVIQADRVAVVEHHQVVVVQQLAVKGMLAELLQGMRQMHQRLALEAVVLEVLAVAHRVALEVLAVLDQLILFLEQVFITQVVAAEVGIMLQDQEELAEAEQVLLVPELLMVIVVAPIPAVVVVAQLVIILVLLVVLAVAADLEL